MPLGPTNSNWARLHEVLAALATDCGGVCSFVVDQGNGLWCAGIPGMPSLVATTKEDEYADRFYTSVIAPNANELRRGKRIEVVQLTGDDRYVGVSFAAIYMLVVWFERDFEPFTVRTKVRDAAPIVEELVMRLPPEGGGGGHRAAKAKRG